LRLEWILPATLLLALGSPRLASGANLGLQSATPAIVLPPAWTPTPSLTRTAAPISTCTPTPTQPPPVAGPRIIGRSLAGRPLEVYQFGTGPRIRMIVAGIHGGYEWNTIALADQLIAHLDRHPDQVPADVTLFILRALNPDGELRAHGIAGRANDAGVDLNRNWPVHWQPDWPRAGCWNYLPITGGDYPTSEPETQALMRFVLDNKVQALISYHSAALGIFPGGEPSDPLSLSLAETVAAVTYYPYPAIDTGCLYTGTLADWASASGIAAVDVELTNHEDTDLAQNLDVLAVFLAWQP
jgi:protein MpaA